MSNDNKYDLTELFSKNYGKPRHNEEKIFKQKYISIENLAQNVLKTDIKKGLNFLDNNDIEWRKKTFGKNEYYTSSEENSFISFLLMSFEDPIIIITFIVSILLIIIDIINDGVKSGYQEGLSIIICLMFYLSLNAYLDYNSKNNIIEYDKIRKEKKCKVIRNNKEQMISNREILVGDIIVLKKGDIVEVDGFCVSEKIISMDESLIIKGENKYKIKQKSKNFIYEKETKNYICPFIFSGAYVLEGTGYMMAGVVGKNIYKNKKMVKEIMEEKNSNYNEENHLNENLEGNDYEDELEEYLNNYGYYKILISALSEQISSIGIYFFFLLGFLSIVKKTVIRMKEGKYFISLEELDIIINGILLALIGCIFSMINSLFMIDLIGFLSDYKKMKKNNIIFKYEKYAELAFVDTLIIIDNKNSLLANGDYNDYNETPKIIRQIKYSGINIIYLSEDNIEEAISKAKKVGILEEYEIEEGRKLLKKYRNLVKENLLVIKENPICLEGNIFYSLCGEIKKEIKKSGNEKITIANLDNFKKVINNLKIVSNIRKEDKLLLFNGFKQIGKIISLYGNNLPDLNLTKIANFAFGQNNDYDILKDYYGLITLDNSLNSFWNAFIYSTNLIYKILQYLNYFISTYLSILIINAIGLIIFRDIPINLIPMIYLLSLLDIASPSGIVEGNINNKLLTSEKFYRNVPLINNKHLLDIVIHIFSRVIIIVFLMVKGNGLFSVESDSKLEHNIWNETNGYHVTILFCTLFFMVLIHLTFIVIETNKNFVQFGLNICVLVIIQILIVNYGGKIARTKPLSQNDLIKCFGIASLVIPVEFLCKIIKK